jgi:hypothetical protein
VTRSALAVVVPALALAATASLRAQQQLYAVDGEVDADRAAFVAALGDVNGDGKPDFVVGAPSAVVGGVATGAVYVRSGVDGSLIYSITGDVKGFGQSVAKVGDVDGDGVSDFVVGSPDAVDPASGKARGAVWCFSGKAGAVLFTKYGPKSNFGTTVAGIGDVNADGKPDVLVGVPADDVTTSRLSLLSGTTGNVIWTLVVSNTRGFGVAGCSVGDLNGDGYDDVLVGDYLATNSAGDVEAGVARIYSGLDKSVLRTYEGEDTTDEFGATIALIGDVDGDGKPDHLIGAARAPSTGLSLGAAYIFSGATGALIQKLQDPTLDGYYATRVADAGDVNGDGKRDFLIGFSAGDDRDAFVNGAWLHSGAGLVPLYRFEGDPADTATLSLASLGDLNGDGRAEILIGALGRYRKAFGDFDGMVRAYKGGKLYLSTNFRSPAAGDTLSLQTAQGVVGNATLAALIAFDGAPAFVPIGAVVNFDAMGTSALSGAVPVGLAGHTFTLQAFALDAQGQLIKSIAETISFQ